MMGSKNICARCGWHFLKHMKRKCPNGKPNPDGSKPRFKRRKATQ